VVHDRLLVSLRRINLALAVALCGSTAFLIYQLYLWRFGDYSLPLPTNVESSDSTSEFSLDSLIPPLPPYSRYESAFTRQGIFAAPQMSMASESDATQAADGAKAKQPSPNRGLLRLVGVVRGDVVQAIIQGVGGRLHTVGLNERVDEFVVVAIEPGRVTLDDHGDTFSITL